MSVLQLAIKYGGYDLKPTSELKVKLTKKIKYSTTSKGNPKVLIKRAKTKNMIKILNVYAPHTQKVKNDSKELDKLHYDINTTTTSIKNSSDTKSDIILIGGDFSAKVGKSRNSDSNQDPCLGRYSKGRRNESGRSLADWYNIHNCLVYNTAFQHPSRHITTWEQHSQQNNKQGYPHLQSDRAHHLSSKTEENFD